MRRSRSRPPNAKHLGGQPPSYYQQARHFAYSHGERFLSAGQTVILGRNGHFTFSSTCSKDNTGQNQVTFDVTANTTADLDGGGPVSAGTKVNIHTDSDALNSTPDAPLKPGDFTQVGSASSSTEIAADGEESDIFYNDGVNWPAGNGSAAHDCFAGYEGSIGGFRQLPALTGHARPARASDGPPWRLILGSAAIGRSRRSARAAAGGRGRRAG